MNAIEYLKQHHHNDCIITKEITLAKFSTVNSNYKHTFEIPCNLLNIVYSGRKVLHTVDGDIEVKPGEAFFMTKGEYVMSEVTGEENYECLLIFFDHHMTKKFIGELPFKLNSKNIKSTFKFRMNNFLRNSANTLKEYLEDKPKFSDELISLKLKELKKVSF